MHLNCEFILKKKSQITKSFCYSVISYKCNNQFTWNHFVTGVLVINDHAIGFVDIYIFYISIVVIQKSSLKYTSYHSDI